LSLPRFHYELNAIEMLWGYANYCACLLYVSHMDRSLASLITQGIGSRVMVSLTKPKNLSHNVWMIVLSLQSTTFSEKPGDILMCIGMCYNCICDWLDNTFQKRTWCSAGRVRQQEVQIASEGWPPSWYYCIYDCTWCPRGLVNIYCDLSWARTVVLSVGKLIIGNLFYFL